ncbi:hypothetical protein CXB77_13315 [Chromatium okenii]|jgi:hypothetical protein|uniref:Uncharacterized protein n=1 Tax=Chromatium okenii TaxID=61644 RepID=A0A2S7XP80_9GAMM|nr:hypothetical protein CXB77_13315 [Chromatium okenii]
MSAVFVNLKQRDNARNALISATHRALFALLTAGNADHLQSLVLKQQARFSSQQQRCIFMLQ